MVIFSVYIVWKSGRVIFYNYHVVIIIGLISRFGTSFLFGVTGFWFLFLMDLAKVELDIGPMGAHVEFLYEELIVGPVTPVQDFGLEVVVEYPLVFIVLYKRLHLCLGGGPAAAPSGC